MDIVVAVPTQVWRYWLTEGDLAVVAPAQPRTSSGRQYEFRIGVTKPDIKPGERVYVASHGRLRGWAPLVALRKHGRDYAAVRAGQAMAVTIPQDVTLRGWGYRRWAREAEIPFPQWQKVSGDVDGIEGVIREVRTLSGWEQGTLARRLDWPTSKLSVVEAGILGVRPSEVDELLRGLDISREVLDAALQGVPVADLLREAAGRLVGRGGEPGGPELPAHAPGPADAAPADGADAGRGSLPGSAGGPGDGGRTDAPGAAGAQRGPLPSRVVADVTLTWEARNGRFWLEARRDGVVKRASIPNRSDPLEHRELIERAEESVLAEIRR